MLLLSGQVVSFIGDQVQDLALPLVVLAITGSPTQAGIVLGLNTVAFIVFGPVAGAFADRWNRKTTMIWCEVCRGLLTASVVLALVLDALVVPHLYVVAVLTGMLTTLFHSANTAALPNIVRATQVPAALGQMQAVANTIRIIGASVAGLVYALGRAVPFVVNTVSFFLSALSLKFIRTEFQQERPAEAEEPASGRRGLTGEIREGLAWAWRQPVVRFLTLVRAADNLRYGAGYLLIIMLATNVGANPFEIGVVFSGAAIGGLMGSVLASRVVNRFPLGKLAATMLWVEALTFPLYAVAPNVVTLAVVALAESVIAPIYTVAMNSYQLTITPDFLQGRVTSAVGTVTFGALSIGTILGGILLAMIDPQIMVLLWSGWLVILAVATTTNKAVRRAPIAVTAAAT